jgi:hypothetical protein
MLECPRRPEVWAGIDSITYTFFWKDETGAERFASVREGEALAVRLRRGEAQAIVAIPSCGMVELKPAGALYPADLVMTDKEYPSSVPDALTLSFGSGYVAAIASYIEAAGRDPWVFPLEKLKSIREDTGCDPWTIAPWKVASALVGGTFRTSIFHAASVVITLPGDDDWMPESPFCLVYSGEGGREAILCDGIYLFYAETEKLVVGIGDGKTILQRTGLWER